jgi:SAM-dependent methyltransferase
MTCVLCGAAMSFAFTVGDRNRAVGPDEFHYERCERCRTLSLANVPADLGRWYPSDYFTLPSVPELDAMAPSEAYKLAAVQAQVTSGRLVEVGPGFGAFARLASVAGFEVSGLELDAACVEQLRTVVGVEAIQTAAPERELAALPPSDAIVLWHSLEHLPDPGALLAAAAANLRSGGVLIAAVPNPQALQFRLLGRRWPHIDAPRHLHLMPAAAVTERAARHGLKRVALTSDDGGARHWNAFGWGRGVLPPAPGKLLSHGSIHLGRAIALAAAPAERRPGRGSAYTITLRKA